MTTQCSIVFLESQYGDMVYHARIGQFTQHFGEFRHSEEIRASRMAATGYCCLKISINLDSWSKGHVNESQIMWAFGRFVKKGSFVWQARSPLDRGLAIVNSRWIYEKKGSIGRLELGLPENQAPVPWILMVVRLCYFLNIKCLPSTASRDGVALRGLCSRDL